MFKSGNLTGINHFKRNNTKKWAGEETTKKTNPSDSPRKIIENDLIVKLKKQTGNSP